MMALKKLPIIRNLNRSIIQTSYPLIISILSYPLFSAVSFSIISIYFSSSTSCFILSQALVTIYIRFGENLLSGTRVLTAQSLEQSILKRKEIFKVSCSISICLSVVALLIAMLFCFVSYFYSENTHIKELTYTLFFLTIGLPGIFIYNSCALYLHAHKKTHSLPIVSWVTNIIGVVLMFLYSNLPNASFLLCLLLLSLSRWILAFLAYVIIPKGWKEIHFHKWVPNVKKMLEITKFGFSHAINSLFFTGSYFLFSIFLEINANDELQIFQVQLSLLGIFSVINSALTNSGCIIFSQIEKSNLIDRNKLIVDNFILNILLAGTLIFICYFFRKFVLELMGGANFLYLFESTFMLFSGIYILDVLQMIFLQIMTYSNHYLMPPLLRIAIFAGTAIPFAFFTTCFLDQGLIGLLSSILVGTGASFLFITNYFRISNRHSLETQ